MRTLIRGRAHGMAAESVGVLIEGAVVSWIGHGSPPDRPEEEVVLDDGEVLAPGFIDLQVNGFGGHDAADGAEAIAAISDALPKTGVTAFLPTLISAPVKVGAEFAASAAAAEGNGARGARRHA